ncbi:MAG: aspartate/glutamate racemase family protein [Dehalococcoidales bacterium]|nr:aspartate/glutamate racemase family protein [Dehalococcoidales bacterium]
MKIWYQTYAANGVDPKWQTYEEELKAYVQQVARPGTKVEIHGVEKYHPKMNHSEYIQYMHVAQVIDKALQAEREGYDAFCLGGAFDLGQVLLKEVLDIPVVFIAESSFYHACLLARKFGIVGMNEDALQRQLGMVKTHGLETRCVPGAHVGKPIMDLVQQLTNDPEAATELFAEAARKVIAQGAGAIIPGFGAWASSFGVRKVRDIDGVPIVDMIAVVIKTAEMLADMQKMGVKKSRGKLFTKADIMAARKLYGAD